MSLCNGWVSTRALLSKHYIVKGTTFKNEMDKHGSDLPCEQWLCISDLGTCLTMMCLAGLCYVLGLRDSYGAIVSCMTLSGFWICQLITTRSITVKSVEGQRYPIHIYGQNITRISYDWSLWPYFSFTPYTSLYIVSLYLSGINAMEVVCKLLEVSNPHIPLRLSKHLRFVSSIIWILKLLEFSNLIHIS